MRALKCELECDGARARLETEGVKKVQEVTSAGRKFRRQKKVIHWEVLPHGRCGLLPQLLSFQDLAGEAGSFPPPWAAPGSRFRCAWPWWARRGASEPPTPTAGDGAAGGGQRQGAGRPVGAGRAVFGGWCAFCFVLILSVVALSSGDPALQARGISSNTCKGMVTASRAAASGRAGELKFKCDPRRGRRRELAAREGPRVQEASAFKGPARPGGEQLKARLPGVAAGTSLRKEVPPKLVSPLVRGL